MPSVNWPSESPNCEELDSLGRVLTYSLEYTITYKCVNHCSACNHFTHIQPKHFVSVEQFRKDVIQLSRICHCDKFSIIGGEALLHPNLLELLDIVKESKIGDMINITTNGQLIKTVGEEFLDKVDRIEMGIYGGKWTYETLKEMLKTLEKHNIKSCYYGFLGDWDIEIVNMARCFAERNKAKGYDWITTVNKGFHYTLNHSRANEEEAQRRFTRCLYGHVCNTIDQGYIFRCPESSFIPALILGRYRGMDGLLIDQLTPEKLKKFFFKEIHTESCHYCCSLENYFPWHEVSLDTSKEEWLAKATEPKTI